jgi:hypothetical protein
VADISDINSAQSIKIIGSSSTGVEQTPVESTTFGELKTSEVSLHYNAVGAATATIKSGSGYLRKITVNRPTNGTATIYDNTTATGTPIMIIAYTNGTSPTTLDYGFQFTTGLTIVTTGANTNLSVMYL